MSKVLNNTMEFFNSKKFIAFMFIVLLCASISGCAKPKPKIDENKLGAIGNMLGCMFNHSLCEKRESQTEQPDDEKEWVAIEEK